MVWGEPLPYMREGAPQEGVRGQNVWSKNFPGKISGLCAAPKIRGSGLEHFGAF
jgi:hypothetical protein